MSGVFTDEGTVPSIIGNESEPRDERGRKSRGLR
jgi:hypothetical protein